MIHNFFENEKGFTRLLIVFLCILLWQVTFKTFDMVMELDFRGRDMSHIVALGGLVQSTTTLVLGYVFKWYVNYRVNTSDGYSKSKKATTPDCL